MTADGLSPRYQGDTSLWTLPQTNRDGTVRSLVGLTTANILLKLQLVDNPQTIIPLTGGTLNISNASGGIFTYHPTASDVAMPGTYNLWAFIQWSGTDWSRSDPYEVVIKASPPAP